MKNKDLIAKLQKEDPEMEVGIECDGRLVRKLKFDFGFINNQMLDEVYKTEKSSESDEYYNTKVLTLVKIEG